MGGAATEGEGGRWAMGAEHGGEQLLLGWRTRAGARDCWRRDLRGAASLIHRPHGPIAADVPGPTARRFPTISPHPNSSPCRRTLVAMASDAEPQREPQLHAPAAPEPAADGAQKPPVKRSFRYDAPAQPP